ncbi:MAG TPA: response regulator [Methanocorpusculum sp.]|nr:response regulator [Methanocorpusculum sp.]
MKKILIIDDDTLSLDISRGILEDTYEVRTAESGRAGFKVMEEFYPDLILLDYIMPEMNGIEFVEKLRAHPEWADIPVFMLTADISDETELACLKAGVYDFLRKPFIREIMLLRIAHVLKTGELETRVNF